MLFASTMSSMLEASPNQHRDLTGTASTGNSTGIPASIKWHYTPPVQSPTSPLNNGDHLPPLFPFSDVVRLRQHVSHLTVELRKAEQQNREITHANEQLQRELENAQTHCKQLQQELDAKNIPVYSSAKKKGALIANQLTQIELEKLTGLLRVRDSTIEELRRQLKQYEQAALTESTPRIFHTDEELHALYGEIERLNLQIVQTQVLYDARGRRIEELEGQLHAVQHGALEMQRTFQHRIADLVQEKGELERQNQLLRLQAKQHEAGETTLRQELSDCQQKACKLEEAVAQYEQQLVSAHATIENLSKQLESQHSLDVREVSHQYEQQLRHQRELFDSERAALQQTLAAKKSKIAQLRRDLQQCQEELSVQRLLHSSPEASFERHITASEDNEGAMLDFVHHQLQRLKRKEQELATLSAHPISIHSASGVAMQHTANQCESLLECYGLPLALTQGQVDGPTHPFEQTRDIEDMLLAAQEEIARLTEMNQVLMKDNEALRIAATPKCSDKVGLMSSSSV